MSPLALSHPSARTKTNRNANARCPGATDATPEDQIPAQTRGVLGSYINFQNYVENEVAPETRFLAVPALAPFAVFALPEGALGELGASIAERFAPKSLQSFFEGGRVPRASELAKFAERQGWTRSQTETGPLKFRDANKVERMTIKEGSARTRGSEGPHVAARNAQNQRINPATGARTTRNNPDNHAPIKNNTVCTGSRIPQSGPC